jgi:hypothetical protein
MATDKRFVVKNGLQTENINFVFNDAVLGSSNITATMLSSNTLSFSGSTGQLFSITDSMTGVIFAVNDISGVPSIEVFDDGRVYFAETFGNVTIGNSVISSNRTSTSTTTGILQVAGGAGITGNINVGGTRNLFTGSVGIGTSTPLGTNANVFSVYGSAMVYGNIDLANPTGGTSGIYFNDGSYQTTAFTGAATPSFGVAGTVQYAGAGNTFAGNSDAFFWDTANSRLGIGTNSPTNVLTVRSTATPAWFNTLNSAVSSNNYEIIVGNGASTGTTVGYVNNTLVPYGYLSAGTATRNITVAANGRVGIGGVTAPQVLLDVGGGAVIGASWAGNSNFINPPTNGLSVQGSVGIGTYTPLNALDVRGSVGVTAASNFGGAVSVASLTSNGAVSGTTGTFTGALYGASFNTAGTATVSALVSNGAISGTTITGTAGTFTSIQNSGLTRSANIVSNTWIHATQNLTVASSNTSTTTATGAAVITGGVGIGGNLNVGGTRSAFTGFVSVGAATVPNYALDVTGEIAIRGGSNPDDARVYFQADDNSNRFTIETDFDATTSNDILGFRAVATDNILVLKGNGFVGIGTSNPLGTLDIRGGLGVTSASNFGGALSVASLASNGAVSGTTGTFTGALYGASFNTAGTATVNALVSNGAVSGTTGTFTGALYGASLNTAGTATVNALVSNTSLQTATVIASSTIQAAGTITGQTISSNTTVTAGTGLTVTSGGVNVTGASQFTGNVSISGNLNVVGTINTQNANVLIVNDPIIYLGEGNTGTNWDLGIVGNYNDGIYEHTGLVRNHVTGVWTLFDTLPTEPNVSTGNVDWSNSSLTYAAFLVGNVNVAGQTASISTTTGAIRVPGQGGVGIGGRLNVGGASWFASTVNAGGAFIAQSINSNTNVVGVNLQSTGQATVSTLVSNGAVSGTTGTFTGALYGASFNTAGTATVNALVSNGTISGTSVTFNGNITVSNGGTNKRGILGTAGDNDQWFFGGGATASNSGFLEIATGDDGTEPIFVRQYSGSPQGGAAIRTFTLLDASGNSEIPGNLTIPDRIIHASDGDTSIRFPANDTFTVETAGIEQLRISSTGNVGIGTSSPFGKLQVNGDVYLPYAVDKEISFRFDDAYRFGMRNTSGDARTLRIFTQAADNDGAIVLATANNVERVRINSSGRVGIGTSNPGELLDVRGNLRLGGTDAGPTYIALRGTTLDGPGLYDHTFIGERIYTPTEQSELLLFKGNDPTTSGPDRIRLFAGDIQFDTYITATSGTFDTIGSSVNAIPRMIVKSTGLVGIGTTAPLSTLDVRGGVGVTAASNFGGALSVASLTSNGAISGTTGTFSGDLTIADKIVHSGDTNTAIRFPANDTFTIETNGTERFRVDASGNVGIGTTTIQTGYMLQVEGGFAAINKSFVIKHPTKSGYKLQYASLEGPENGVYVRGRLKGESRIELPDYWLGLVDQSTITVNLTPIGHTQNLYVSDIDQNSVWIGADSDADIHCFYTVYAERKDIEKLTVEYKER